MRFKGIYHLLNVVTSKRQTMILSLFSLIVSPSKMLGRLIYIILTNQCLPDVTSDHQNEFLQRLLDDIDSSISSRAIHKLLVTIFHYRSTLYLEAFEKVPPETRGKVIKPWDWRRSLEIMESCPSNRNQSVRILIRWAESIKLCSSVLYNGNIAHFVSISCFQG